MECQSCARIRSTVVGLWNTGTAGREALIPDLRGWRWFPPRPQTYSYCTHSTAPRSHCTSIRSNGVSVDCWSPDFNTRSPLCRWFCSLNIVLYDYTVCVEGQCDRSRLPKSPLLVSITPVAERNWALAQSINHGRIPHHLWRISSCQRGSGIFSI